MNGVHMCWGVRLCAALLLWALTAFDASAGVQPPSGLPNYTHPVDPRERVRAVHRVLAVYKAIDAATPDPTLRAELRRICRRESACNWIGEVTYHEGDAAGGRARWEKAVARGWLDPARCDEHKLGDPARWTSYGPFGIAAAWTVRYVGDCAGPSVLDDPRVAARAAVRWVNGLCRRQGACDCESRTKWWIGPGVWEERPPLLRLASVERQCGDVPWFRWLGAAVANVMWYLPESPQQG